MRSIIPPKKKVNKGLNKEKNISPFIRQDQVLWKNELANKPNLGNHGIFKDQYGHDLYDENRIDEAKYLNFAEVPYFKKDIDGETLLDFEILKELKEASGKQGSNLYEIGKLFNNYTLNERHLNIFKKLYENNELEAFETYLALLLDQTNPKYQAYVRDMIYEMFPEVHEKRENYYKENCQFYKDIAKRALYQIPREPKDIYTSYYLSIGDGFQSKEDREKERKKKFDEDILKEFLFRDITRPYNSRDKEPDMNMTSFLLNPSKINVDDGTRYLLDEISNLNKRNFSGFPIDDFGPNKTPRTYGKWLNDDAKKRRKEKYDFHENIFRLNKKDQNNKNDKYNMWFNKFI